MESELLSVIELDDSYRLVKILADHPTGVTELVISDAGEDLLVRKRIPLEYANHAAWSALSRVSHPRLPRVVESYELPDAFVVVCDFVDGISCESIVESSGALHPSSAVVYLAELCDAVYALHEAGIIHRDISPSNVIIAGDGVHLIDLGIARVGDPEARSDTTRLGTWGFAAPEQYGFAQTNERSDVYSIGCLAGFMLTGVRPDEADYNAQVDRLPPEFAAVIHRACAFEPSSRYPDVSALSRAFLVANEKYGATTIVSSSTTASSVAPKVLFHASKLFSKEWLLAELVVPSKDEIHTAFRSSSALGKSFAVLAWVVSLFFILAYVVNMPSSVEGQPNTGWVISTYLGLTVIYFGIAWAFFDLSCAVLGCGAYRLPMRRLPHVILRLIMLSVAVLLVASIIVFMAIILFGSPNKS